MGLNVHISKSHEVFRGCDGEAAPYVEICIEASAPRRPLIAMALLHEGLHNVHMCTCAHAAKWRCTGTECAACAIVRAQESTCLKANVLLHVEYI